MKRYGWYKGLVDDKSVKVEIIQEIKNKVNSRYEIIRLSRIDGREYYSGFWVNKSEVNEN